MFTQIRWRMVRWNVAVFGLILLVVGGSTYIAAARRLPYELDRELEARGAALTAAPRALEREEFAATQAGYRGGYFYLGLNQQGDIVVNPQQATVPDLPAIDLADPTPQFYTVTVRGEPVRLYIRPLPPPPTLPPGVSERRRHSPRSSSGRASCRCRPPCAVS